MKKRLIIILIILGLFLAGGLFWYFKFKKRNIFSGLEVEGYKINIIGANDKDNSEVSYKPESNQNKEIQRVVADVSVKVEKYQNKEEAQKQIEEASLVYIWEWRKEKIADNKTEVSTGFLFSPGEGKYKEAYLAWIEDETIYYEVIAKPAEIKNYSDKEYLYNSAKEIAEKIINEK